MESSIPLEKDSPYTVTLRLARNSPKQAKKEKLVNVHTGKGLKEALYILGDHLILKPR